MKSSESRSALRESLEAAGHGIELAFRTVLALPHLWRRRRETLDQMYLSSVRVLHVVVLVGAFAGMILALQAGITLAGFGQQVLVSKIVSAAVVREMGPFITAVILAAAVGSAMAAELGTMTVSEEVTALEVMSIDPVPYLVLPRVVALTLACPILTVIADFVGVVGGGLIAESLLGVDFQQYLESAYESMRTLAGTIPVPKGLYAGLVKALVFGFTISVLSCSCGLRARGGAMGVGEAARSAVRNSIILILVGGFILTRFLYL